MRKSILLLTFLALFLSSFGQTYDTTWQSIDQRPVPNWFHKAKFGIFIHWGPYSVPAFRERDYAEWYRYNVMERPGENFHTKMYGNDFDYREFGKMFHAELFDPAQWADLFQKAGAKYVVLTSKHHDGFCLWPTKSKYSKNWNSLDIGPHRDLVGDLTKAVRSKGLKMGLYYSLLEWENPSENRRWLSPSYIAKYKIPQGLFMTEHIIPQLKDLVINYQPSVIWSDGEWENTNESHYKNFISWLYNHAPNKEEVVINDRWLPKSGKHGDFFSTEYSHFNNDLKDSHPWEEIQGIGLSFGLNKMERSTDYRSAERLIRLLLSTVSKGGNLLLNIGPDAHGKIPPIMEERLLQIGNWLNINGEAIYETEPWAKASEQKSKPLNIDRKEGEASQIEALISKMEVDIAKKSVYYTTKEKDLYAICLKFPEEPIEIANVKIKPETKISLLGHETVIQWKYDPKQNKIIISPSGYSSLKMPPNYPFAFKITEIE